MSDKTREFIFNLVFGAVVAAVVLAIELTRGRAVLVSLCNCFFVAAVLLLGVGGLRGVRNKGAFDVMGFGLKSTIETFIPMLRKGEKETFLDYRERKEAARKSADGLLLAGAAYLALSVIVLVIYQIVK